MNEITLPHVKLEDKYTKQEGKVYITGTQALVRLLMAQKRRDEEAGLNTAGYVSGYRGSPLGALDQELWRNKQILNQHSIKFNPGLNEELAATAVWGTQMLDLDPMSKVQGVFSLWYGKGPGVDRCGDVFKHGNIAGTSKHGGVVLVAGDDHSCKSSSLPHQSEHAFIAAMIPVINPASVSEFIELGLHAFAMSRYSGCWIGFKSISDTIESSSSIDIDPSKVQIKIPDSYPIPEDGFHFRWPDPPLEQEKRLQRDRLFALLEYVRLNGLNRQEWRVERARIGIIATGKSYRDVKEAFRLLGISDELAKSLGIRFLKIGVSWPLEPKIVREFSEGLEEILVVEEKRQIIEYQLKEQLYNNPVDSRPRVVGKYDEVGEWVQVPSHGILLSPNGELDATQVAKTIQHRLEKLFDRKDLKSKLRLLDTSELRPACASIPNKAEVRSPFFCAGCPHNTSTRVPEGSKALAGIGCHYMAQWMDRKTDTFSQMGGEGVTWLGQAPFTHTPHVFANLGDGTYMHSGSLAIRAAVASGVNITYKILVNSAVAMTGGQPVEGAPSVSQIVAQVQAEGVKEIHVVTDQPALYPASVLPAGVKVSHRDELERIQLHLREVPGVTVIVYEQMCAAEKRRKRKRQELEDPPARMFINPDVCEGCGDCGVQSNCVSILPLETELGRKREIDQSACNKDYSCAKGFCPSFVSIEGKYRPKSGSRQLDVAPQASEELPPPPSIPESANIIVAGVGGTGIVTIGAILGMASHLEGKQVLVLDMAGLSQKGGAVSSHVRISAQENEHFSARIPHESADVLIGADLLVSAGKDCLPLINASRTQVVLNSDIQATGDFVTNPDWGLDTLGLKLKLKAKSNTIHEVNATELATRLIGDGVATNMFLLGYAWQKGLIPLQRQSIIKAIEINGVSVKQNNLSFLWGQNAACQPERIPEWLGRNSSTIIQWMPRPARADLMTVLKDRTQRLVAYQSQKYAQQYQEQVLQVQAWEKALTGGETISLEVAKNLYKLMAYKDEYEVARLHSSNGFLEDMKSRFEGDVKVRFHLAPPGLAKRGEDGRLQKAAYGAWVYKAFQILARMKWLRGTVFDIFGYTEERKQERQLIQDYRAALGNMMSQLSIGPAGEGRLKQALHLAALPQQVRGFGHVKEKSIHRFKIDLEQSLQELKQIQE